MFILRIPKIPQNLNIGLKTHLALVTRMRLTRVIESACGAAAKNDICSPEVKPFKSTE